MARRAAKYTRDELHDPQPPGPLTGRSLSQIAFPLGGLGTGMVSLGGWGQLRDWEIRNRPAKGFQIPQAFFTLHCDDGQRTVAKVLQGPFGGDHVGDGHTLGHHAGQGLPHFREVSFDGRFPIATVSLRDETVPLRVELEAFNPFIPLDDKDSGIPVAILIYRLTNPTRRHVTATVFGNLANVIGDPQRVTRVSKRRRAGGIAGLYLATDPPADGSPELGTMALATPLDGVKVLPNWATDHVHQWLNCFCNHVIEQGVLPRPGKAAGSGVGSIAVTVELAPGATVEVPMLIAWHFPRVGHWQQQEQDGCDCTPTWANWYAGVWRDAWDVAAYTAANLDRLRAETHRFRDALFASTVPGHVLDAVSSQMSILKTPSCLRLPDGTFYGFEGCSNTSGCCEGSCTHVWNYAQALPYLFPALQRSMREKHWEFSLLPDGWQTFRMPLPLGTPAGPTFFPAADGQMGSVAQIYREWLISGDDAWLKSIWPRCKQALEFAWVYWDADRDGVMEGLQHNTYDNEFYGPNTMMGSLYLAALRAAEEMARRLGDPAADEYRRLFESGSKWTDEHLFNGDYYEQDVRPEALDPWPEAQRKIGARGMDSRFPDWPAWQFGKGCLSDQLIGQWYAAMLGLGDLYDRRHVKQALKSIFAHNWRAELHDHACRLRVYAVGDEPGLLIGTWPRGERPGEAFWFADEVWTGIEYQVASHLIYEGLVDEGLTIVKGVRDRYTGERRNPWNEIECGHHYTRAMASYGLLLALSGFRYRAADGHLDLDPKLDVDPFRTFFSVASGWGTITVKRGEATTVEVAPEYGQISVASIALPIKASAVKVTGRLGRRSLKATVERGVLRLAEPAHVAAGESLVVTAKV